MMTKRKTKRRASKKPMAPMFGGHNQLVPLEPGDHIRIDYITGNTDYGYVLVVDNNDKTVGEPRLTVAIEAKQNLRGQKTANLRHFYWYAPPGSKVVSWWSDGLEASGAGKNRLAVYIYVKPDNEDEEVEEQQQPKTRTLTEEEEVDYGRNASYPKLLCDIANLAYAVLDDCEGEVYDQQLGSILVTLVGYCATGADGLSEGDGRMQPLHFMQLLTYCGYISRYLEVGDDSTRKKVEALADLRHLSDEDLYDNVLVLTR